MGGDLETRHLRQVATLARSGTFASAARALGLSQPALTRSIQSLERDLGVALFDRHARGVTPTPLGELLVARAEHVLSLVTDLRRELEQMQGVGSGVLRIGAGPAMRSRILPRALAQTCRRHPRLNVEVRLGDWRLLARALLDREIDIMLAERSEAEGDERFEIMPLASEVGKWFVRPGHPVLEGAGGDALPLSALRDCTLALPSIPDRLRPLFAGLFGDAAKGPASVIECDDVQVLKAIAIEGDAVALLSDSIAEEEVARGRLVDLPVDGTMPATHPGAIWLRGRSLSPAGEACLSALRP